MLKIIKKIFKTGSIAETLATPAKLPAGAVEMLGQTCQKLIVAKFGGSLAIRHVDAGSCNACELGIHALNNVFYQIEQYGIHFVASPRHADVLLVTGVVARNMEAALRIAYEMMPAPKLVVAVGDCATTGGEFDVSYASVGKVANVIPVDVMVHGCPPTPLAILQGILAILQK